MACDKADMLQLTCNHREGRGTDDNGRATWSGEHLIVRCQNGRVAILKFVSTKLRATAGSQFNCHIVVVT
jgi:hypothetical protein